MLQLRAHRVTDEAVGRPLPHLRRVHDDNHAVDAHVACQRRMACHRGWKPDTTALQQHHVRPRAAPRGTPIIAAMTGHLIAGGMMLSLNSDLRVGLKGTARLEGEQVPLAYWVLRRPLAIARQYLAL